MKEQYFYFKFNKVVSRSTSSADSGIYIGENPKEIPYSYHGYSIQDPNSYTGIIAGPYSEDVGGDVFEDPKVPFYYLALREITLSYNVPTEYFNDVIKRLSVYVTGSNLHYFKSVSGDTPEIGGVQYGAFPVPKTFTMGLNLTF